MSNPKTNEAKVFYRCFMVELACQRYIHHTSNIRLRRSINQRFRAPSDISVRWLSSKETLGL